MKTKNLLAGTCLAASLLLGAASSQAAFKFEPLTDLGLSPGDTYRYAFVTSTTTTALSSDISDYNDFVNSAANQAGSVVEGSSITWSAWASTETVDAIANIGGDFAETIFRLDGATIAAGSNDLTDGSIANPVSLDEFLASNSSFVWTGTSTSGEGDSELGTSLKRYGFNQVASARWTDESVATGDPAFALYAFSEELVVPAVVPLPTTVTLLAFGLLSVFAAARRRVG